MCSKSPKKSFQFGLFQELTCIKIKYFAVVYAFKNKDIYFSSCCLQRLDIWAFIRCSEDAEVIDLVGLKAIFDI